MGIVPAAVERVAEQHELTLVEQGLLMRLLLLANFKTATIEDTTLEELADTVGLHRHNLRPKLDRLHECGLIDRRFPKGHRGSVVVTSYPDLVYLSPSQVANHALRKSRFAAIRDDGDEAPQVANRAVTSSDSRGATSTRLSMSAPPAAPRVEQAQLDIAPTGPRGRRLTGSYPKDFEAFWSLYPRKKAKGDAEKAYRTALGHADQTEILDGLRRSIDEWKREDRPIAMVPYPAKWLRDRSWSDEPDEETPGRASRRTHRQQQTDKAWAATQALHQAIANGDLPDDINPLDALTGGAS